MIKAFALSFVRLSLPLTFADLLGSKLPFVRGVFDRMPLPSLGIFALGPAAGRGSQVIVAGREGNRFFLSSLPATGERDASGPAPIGRGGPLPLPGASRSWARPVLLPPFCDGGLPQPFLFARLEARPYTGSAAPAGPRIGRGVTSPYPLTSIRRWGNCFPLLSVSAMDRSLAPART